MGKLSKSRAVAMGLVTEKGISDERNRMDAKVYDDCGCGAARSSARPWG